MGAAANLSNLWEECYGDGQCHPKTCHADNHLDWEMQPWSALEEAGSVREGKREEGRGGKGKGGEGGSERGEEDRGDKGRQQGEVGWSHV